MSGGLKLKLKGRADVVEKPAEKKVFEEIDEIFGDENQANEHTDTNKVESSGPKLKIVHGEQKEDKKKSISSNRKKVNKYFYKVSNHHELFKIGRSFYDDYMTGVKSFAISSTGYQTSQQNSILGLACFFDHKENLRIGIVSDNLTTGAFKDIVSISRKKEIFLEQSEAEITAHSFYDHFDFLDLNELLDVSNDSAIDTYDEIFDEVVDEYDIVFWDVPELHKIQQASEKYFPVIMKFESLSIIVAQNLSHSKDIDEIRNFFLGYGINLKGLLLETKSVEQKEEGEQAKSEANDQKKPWWRIFS